MLQLTFTREEDRALFSVKLGRWTTYTQHTQNYCVSYIAGAIHGAILRNAEVHDELALC